MRGHREIVLAGAGHAVLVALNLLARRPVPGVCVTLISRGSAAWYSGMIPGWIEGIYGADAMAVPVAPVTERAGARLIVGDIVGADDGAVHLADGSAVAFDRLVINTGSVNALPGALAHPQVIPARPVAALPERLAPALDRASAFAVVGAGVAGVETALALKARRPDAAVTLVERSADVLPGGPAGFRRAVAAALAAAGVCVRTRAVVNAVRDREVVVDGTPLCADAVLALTGAAPPPWLAATPFSRGDDGFLAIDEAMLSVSHQNVMAVGDAGTSVAAPRPKAGVFSVRAGPHVARAIRAWGAGAPVPDARLQRRGLVLLSTGGRQAVGTRNGITVSGRWVWRLKDRLDRAFVARFGPIGSHRTGV